MTETREVSAVPILAAILHEADRAFLRAIGSDDLPAWDRLNEDFKTNKRDAVRSFLTTDTPEEAHALATQEMSAAGVVYGPEFDMMAEPPTHPFMVPYACLPRYQRQRTALAQAVVTAGFAALTAEFPDEEPFTYQVQGDSDSIEMRTSPHSSEPHPLDIDEPVSVAEAAALHGVTEAELTKTLHLDELQANNAATANE